MFERDRIKFYGENLDEAYGPTCVVDNVTHTVGPSCVDCKNCYHMKIRYWTKTTQDGTVWHNASYDGQVWCAKDNPNFIRKIKNHIFVLRKRKPIIKHF